MSVRPTSDLTRHVIQTCSRVRFASTTATTTTPAAAAAAAAPATPAIRTRKPRHLSAEHGQQIYVFHQFQTNQIVYSLKKSLKNNAALRQLPYNGKKTVPRALRKDLWKPLALISFPSGTHGQAIGLTAFQKLREYRRLHELSWDDSLRTDDDGKTLSRLQRGRKLRDQKANSVADIATVLGAVGRPEGEAIGLAAMPNARPGADPAPPPTVEVRWSNLVDAQFASSWTPNVVHDQLQWEQHLDAEAALTRERRLKETLLQREEVKRIQEEKERTRPQRHELHLATKAEKHAAYLARRGISEEQHQEEVQELLRAKAERQAAKA